MHFGSALCAYIVTKHQPFAGTGKTLTAFKRHDELQQMEASDATEANSTLVAMLVDITTRAKPAQREEARKTLEYG